MHMLPTTPPHGRRQAGYVLLWLLFAVAVLGVAMAAVGSVWHAAAQREREQQLLFVGDQYRRALESYWQAATGNQRQLPKSLDDLLLDARFPNTVRHLRRLYPDPNSGKAEWGLVRDANGGISGIHSLSDKTPYKTGGFPKAYAQFAGAKDYRAWVFVATTSDTVQAAPGADAAGSGQEAGGVAGAGATPAVDQGDRVPDATQLQRLACLREKEAASVECSTLQGQAQRDCHTQVFQRHRECLQGTS